MAGLAAWLLFRWPLPPLIGGDAFFLIYLVLMTRFSLGATPDGLRERAGVEDEGILPGSYRGYNAGSLELIVRQSATNLAQTWRMARPLRKSAIVL